VIHVIETEEGCEVWTDPEADIFKTGRCLAIEKTRSLALTAAIAEIEDDMEQAVKLFEGKEAA
jgi:hypothetical protein